MLEASCGSPSDPPARNGHSAPLYLKANFMQGLLCADKNGNMRKTSSIPGFPGNLEERL